MQKRYLMFLLCTLLGVCAFLLPAAAQAASVSGIVWNDKTVDGLYQKENNLDKAQITLESHDGVVATATTDRSGEFIFDNLTAGEYRLSVTLPNNFVPTVPGLDSALLPSQNETCATAWFFVDGNQTVNLGATKSTVYVSIVAFVDENANGGRMLSEPTLQGVKVDLIYAKDGVNYVVASGETDKNGGLYLRPLSPATYHIAATLPEHYIVGPKGVKLNTYYNCVNPSEGETGVSDDFTLTKGSLGLAVGAVKTGNAQGSIWYDKNYNGRRDADESGFSGAVVTLTSDEFGLTRTAQVSEDGSYLFSQLQPSTYTLTVTLEDGVMFTLPGGDSQFTDGYTNTQSATVIVTAESTTNIKPVGVMDATSLLVTFFHDADADGMLNGQETPFAGAQISVLADGKQVASATSDENGEALIPILRGGNVTVTASLPEGSIFSNGGDDNQFIPVGAQNTCTIEAVIEDAQQTRLSAAETTPCAIEGVLYADENNNGVRDANEGPMAGFTVQAVDGSENIVATTVTDENGAYTLSPLLPDGHSVRFLLTDPYIAAPYAPQNSGSFNAIIFQNSEYGVTDVYALYPGQTLTNIDGGVFKAGTVSGVVLLNKNHDQLQTNEGGLAGVTVSLIDDKGNEYSDYTKAVTDENGAFYIKGVLPGTYTVRYQMPADAVLTDLTSPLSCESAPFVSTMGSEITVDAVGAVKTATVSGSITYLGAPLDGYVTLVSDTYGETKDAAALQDGTFTISLLRPDTYQVRVELSDGYVFAYDTCALVPSAAQNVSTSTLTLDMGQVLDGQAIIAAKPATLSGVAYYDENNSGAHESDETLYNDFSFTMYDMQGTEVAALTTNEDGQFVSPALIPGAYTLKAELPSDCVMVNAGAQKDASGVWSVSVTLSDGENSSDYTLGVLRFGSLSGSLWSMDGSTDNLSGLTVSLYATSAPEAPLATAVTDGAGAYAFENLYPDEYYLTASLPAEHMFARTADTSERQSMILADTDAGKRKQSEPFFLSMGEDKTNADIGFGAKGEIGDFAWLDENGNGLQDIGEKGIPGIVIALYQYGEQVAETVTDVYGHYFFDNLYPGVYSMKVTMHDELKATKHTEDFPLVNSVLPQTDETTVTVEDIVVPSGARDLSCDLGFVLRKDGKYPAVMDTIPTTDWSYGGTKNN